MEERKGDVPSLKSQESLGFEPDDPTHHFEQGIVLWKKGEGEGSKELKSKAVEHFVVSAKLNPRNGAAFRYLGHYYSTVSVDTQRASKCYQRAVALDPDDFEAGEGLCDVLDAEGKESLEVSICREASEKSPRAFWAFRRLGYLQVHQKMWPEAVQSLQHAIRGYPASADLWESLGLAYHRLGMLTAALKSYGRAIELEGSNVFALVESGCILLMLGSFSKAVKHFRSALVLSPQKMAACFGLASGLLGLSRECMNSGAFSWGATLLEEASKVARTCANLVGNISSSWKLLGDIQMAHARCFPWSKDSNDIKVDRLNFETSIHNLWRTRLSSAVNAKYSYQHALHLAPWQAMAYTDLANSLDLVYALEKRDVPDVNMWNLPGKLSLGGLMLEGGNKDIWTALGCLANNNVLKQHAFIRGLQLDVSFAVGWAHLGKLYRSLGEIKLSKQAFDHARSIDPSLALPWAGMSVGISPSTSQNLIEEAYESCLRAVQTLPLADFEVGLGAFATLSGHLLSPQVFCAVKQAVQHAPFYPESHNLDGLVCEARLDFQSSIAAYQRAKFTLDIMPTSILKDKAADVSINLARSLCRAGYVLDAARECEELKKQGLLDGKGLQVYAVSLFKLGKNEMALEETRNLASGVSKMDESSRVAALLFICKLIYFIKGLDSTIATIVKFPSNYVQSPKVKVIIHAINALGNSSIFQSVLPHSSVSLMSHEEIGEMHYLDALGKMILSVDAEESMGLQNAVKHLKKALHMYPNNGLIRIQLGSLQLSSKLWMAPHIATRCLAIRNDYSTSKFSKSPFEVLGSASVACYACCTAKQKSAFTTCKNQFPAGIHGLHLLQKWLHQEPWNYKAHYLLVLNILQKAREESFPRHICDALKRMILTCLSNEIYVGTNHFYDYQKFQLLLAVSEICLQCGYYIDCVSHAADASRMLVSRNSLFFAYLQMCRAYAAMGDWQNLASSYMNCLRTKTNHEIGWISLKYLGYRFMLLDNLNRKELDYESFPMDKKCHESMWEAISDFVLFQRYVWDVDFIRAEETLNHANSLGTADGCLLLCHGAVCMELARQGSASQFLSLARSCLLKAKRSVHGSLPIVSILLAQAEGSLGSKAQWEKYIRAEWFTWPSEMRPAEVYFQMHLLANKQKKASNLDSCVELCQSPEGWVLRAVHLNPSCARYWKILRNLTQFK